MRVTVEMITVLREKYREIKRLRTLAGDHLARGQAHDPKREMAALARRFPGALRELDELPLPVVDERLAQLDEAIESRCVPEWAALQVGYHGTYRFALRIRRSVARQGARKGVLDEGALEQVMAELRAAASDESLHAQLDEPRLEGLDAAALRGILRPAGGRLHRWVLEQVAMGAGVSATAVSAALFLRERTLNHSF